MEDLNTQQIILLTLLVSFVTSIATGITTVSLLEQAPDPVTQTINRVVEKTIERVVMEPSEKTETVIERQVETIIVNQEDLTIEAVDKNSRSLVRIYSTTGDLRNLVALGLVINGSGDIVTEGTKIQEGAEYIGVYKSGEFPVKLNSKNQVGSMATLSVISTEENPNPNNFSPATFADSKNLKLGQSVISLSGESRNTVSTGIINDLITDSESGKYNSIKTSLLSRNVLVGSIILNLQGEVIGLNLGSDVESTSFIPSNMVKSFVLEGDLALAESEIDTE